MKQDAALRRAKGATVSVIRAAFLIAFSFILIYPVIFMISNAIKVNTDTINPAVDLFSRSPTWEGFKAAFIALDFWDSLLNTVIYELVSAVLEVLFCALYAYGLSRYKIPCKKLLMFFLVLMILVPDIMLIIPRIVNFRYFDFMGILGFLENLTALDLRPNLIDTVFPFYLPSILGVGLKGGVFIFIYMQFFKGLPVELEEAAWIDGANPLMAFIRIIIPSSGVVFLTVFIFSFIWHWNDWLLATMYTSNVHTLAYRTLNISSYISFAITEGKILTESNRLYGAPLAACLLFIAIPLFSYLLLQRKFIQSIDRVGIVG